MPPDKGWKKGQKEVMHGMKQRPKILMIETTKPNGRSSTLSSPRCSLRSLIRSAPRPLNVELSYALIDLLPLRARRTATSAPPNKSLELCHSPCTHTFGVGRVVPPLSSTLRVKE